MKYSLYMAVAAVLTTSLMAWQPIEAAPAPVAKARGYEPPTVFQAAGPDAASIQATVDAFRAELGEVNNGNASGPLASGRREINWDGGGSTATAIAATPFAGFLNTRGALFVTPGSGFVQAPSSGLAETFSNPDYATIFAPFSPVRLFSPIGSNVTHVEFFLPGSAGGLLATTRGFGTVVSDVDLPDGSGPGGKQGNRKASTLVEYFGLDGGLLYSNFVPASPGDAGLCVPRHRIRRSARRPRADQHRQCGARGRR